MRRVVFLLVAGRTRNGSTIRYHMGQKGYAPGHQAQGRPPHFFDAPQFITPDGRDLELECRFKNMRSHYVHDSAQSY